MKPSTEIHWKFENRGTKSDDLSGSGNFIELAKTLATWMSGVTMNNKIVIEVNRKPIISDSLDSLSAELDALFDESLFDSSMAKD